MKRSKATVAPVVQGAIVRAPSKIVAAIPAPSPAAAPMTLESEVATLRTLLASYRQGMHGSTWYREAAILSRHLRRSPWADTALPRRCLRVVATLLQEVRCGTHTMKVCLVMMASVAQIRSLILKGPLGAPPQRVRKPKRAR